LIGLNKVLLSEFELFNIDFVIIVSSKILIALGTLSLPRFIPRFKALRFVVIYIFKCSYLVTENVKAFCQNRVFLFNIANWALKSFLVALNLLVQDHIGHITLWINI